MQSKFFVVASIVSIFLASCHDEQGFRMVKNFNESWYFKLADYNSPQELAMDTTWRKLNLPHDWSIEGKFDSTHASGVGGGALPGGIGWYMKAFELNPRDKDKKVFIQFDGVYQNSTVWINGEKLGTRPNGYISFEYDLTPYVFFETKNVLVVKVDNSQQPNSRWYSGSGIYRDVRLVVANKVYVPRFGTYVTTPAISANTARVAVQTQIKNETEDQQTITLITSILDPKNQEINERSREIFIAPGEQKQILQDLMVDRPVLWTLENPRKYTVRSLLQREGKPVDSYETPFGIRTVAFDMDEGFMLNGKQCKIKGVCLHHDLGCLGAAFNKRAMERQLQIMKDMGVNAVRTSHNPPAPAMLDLCDEMGILVMDEMFDMWAKKKTEFDYSQYWDEWHEQDLRDFIRRDRNHPSVVVWSVGNEIIEQYDHEDTTGGVIAQELVSIVSELDTTRAITTANNDTSPDNPLIKYGGMDLIGYNYHHEQYEDFPKNHPGKAFIATETNSALATRGHYDMPSDSIRKWPIQWDLPFTEGNPDNTVSAYDHVHAPWGSTQEATWDIVKKHDFISGMFIWTGFDYIGEPTPYGWPSRSSYFGVVDLAGFPKDTYYMYKSEWTEDTVLHVFPHWNLPAGQAGWQEGQEIDVWAYYNQADEVELFLNGESKGTRSKKEGEYHVMWRLTFEPGEVEVVSRKNGELVKSTTVSTAGAPARIMLAPDRRNIDADGRDLSFVTIKILDDKGIVVPNAENLINLEVSGAGSLAGVDNGNPVSHDSFKASKIRAFHGLGMAVIQSKDQQGSINIKAVSDGLAPASVKITVN